VTYTQPFTLLSLLIIAVGLLGLRRHWKTLSWRIAACGFLGMVALTWPPAVALTAQPLTCWYPKQTRPTGSADAIVVLSGAVNYPTKQRPYVLAGRDTYRRVLHGAWLYHNWKAIPILATGGPEGGGDPAAVTMRRMLEQEDVPAASIWTEERSHSTHESALYSAAVLREHGVHQVALVVEADSMLRAEKCFRKEGIGVTPAPCLFRDTHFGGEDLLPGWPAIYRAETLMHEELGLCWYWLRGWI